MPSNIGIVPKTLRFVRISITLLELLVVLENFFRKLFLVKKTHIGNRALLCPYSYIKFIY